MLSAALPAVLLVALVNATAPPLMQGKVPVCTVQGVRWLDAGESPDAPGDAGRNACAHGWCSSRRGWKAA